MTDLSGRGNHATQDITSARPILARVPASGRRNRLVNSEGFAGNDWIKTNVTVSGSQTDSLGGTTASKLEETTANGVHQISLGGSQNVAIRPAGSYVYSIEFKAAERNLVRFFDGFQSGVEYLEVDLSAGTVTTFNSPFVPLGTLNGATIENLGNGWFKVNIFATFTTSTATGAVFAIRISSGTTTSYAGTTGHGVFINRAQLEESSTATPYQRVGSTFDVTEAGQPDNFFLFNDLIDDVINWTAPADDYSIARINAGATVTLLASQALSGATNLLNTARTGPYIAVDRALTTAEQGNVTAYLEGKGGGL
jgi:hypothetical protein